MIKPHMLTEFEDKVRALYGQLPEPVRQISDALRLNRPVIVLQVIWPCLWGFMLLSDAQFIRLPALVAMAVLMAMVAFVYLDLADCSPDKDSETYTRAPTSLLAALLLAGVLALVVMAWNLNGSTALLTILWLMLVAA